MTRSLEPLEERNLSSPGAKRCVKNDEALQVGEDISQDLICPTFLKKVPQ